MMKRMSRVLASALIIASIQVTPASTIAMAQGHYPTPSLGSWDSLPSLAKRHVEVIVTSSTGSRTSGVLTAVDDDNLSVMGRERNTVTMPRGLVHEVQVRGISSRQRVAEKSSAAIILGALLALVAQGTGKSGQAFLVGAGGGWLLGTLITTHQTASYVAYRST
jgi:hypothetical protein